MNLDIALQSDSKVDVIYMYIALCRFLHIEAISRQKEARSRDYALLLF